MPRYFIHFSFVLFILTASSGVILRAMPYLPQMIVPYDNILHGHSHIAILGWAFLGLFVIFLALIWEDLKEKLHAIILTITIFIVSSVMFIAFLYEGYAMYSIIMSTIHIFVEYWAAIFIYRQLKQRSTIPKTAKLFIKGSLIALVLSSIGPFALGYLGATGLRESDFFEISIYFFLHFQYNGWLFLGLIGVFIFILSRRGITLSVSAVRASFWIYFIALFPWFLSAIVWADIGNLGESIALIGNIGQGIGVFLFILVVVKAWQSIRNSFLQTIRLCLAISFILLGFKSFMELGLIVKPLAVLVFETRPVIVGYLHLTLLGFISIFILTLMQMIQLINTKQQIFIAGSILFAIGFVVNELVLFMMGLLIWTSNTYLPFANELLLGASLFLFVGVITLWIAYTRSNTSA